MNHSFDIDVAQEVGVEAAILFNSIQHWCARNEANREAQRDGYTWMYNSRSAWCELFPYLGEKQIRNALERLLDAKLIERAHFSAGSVNRTYWYRLAERAKAFGPKGQTVGRKGQTITSTDNTTEKDNPSVSPQPTKASRRANPGISLAVFLANSFNSNGAMPVGWEEYPGVELQFTPDLVERCWRAFHRYFTGPDCSKPLKRDWHRAWENWCDREAQNGRGGRGSGGTAGGGLAAALRTSVANRYGASQPDGGVGGREAAGTSEPDTGGTGGRLRPGEIPF